MSVEIESKFIVPDRRAFHRIQELQSIAGFTLTAGRLVEVVDTYLDTPDGAVLKAGYALRRRQREGSLLVTLKSTTPSTGGLHRREEWETVLAADVAPAMWPPSEARDRVVAIAGGQALAVLFQLRQQRFLRDARDGDRRVAEVSLDDVQVEVSGRREEYRELEIELAPEGREEELARMAEWMRGRHDLLPSARSKFERALELVVGRRGTSPARRRTRRAPGSLLEETVIMEAPEEMKEDDLLAKLALMGFSARPPSRRSDRVIFRDTHDGALLRAGFTLCYSHGAGSWRLAKGDRLEAAERGTPVGPSREGDVGAGLSPVIRAWPSVDHLDATLEEAEYRLAGLAEKQVLLLVQHWQLASPFQEVPARSSISLRARGDPSATGVRYFRSLLVDRLGCRPLPGTILAWGISRLGLPVPGESPPRELSLSSADGLRSACRKILSTEAWRMRASLKGARHDRDPEYVHDFRVATRRSRFALKLFAGILPDGRADGLRAELAWIASLLGAVRDVDVLLARLDAQFFLMEARTHFQSEIRGLLEERRGQSQAELAEALQSERCSALLQDLARTPDATEAPAEERTPQVFARRRIDKAFAQLDNWRRRPAESLQDTELHGLRILFKRLRYTCDFFRPLLGSEVAELTRAFVAYQDCLGLHQDARVALEMLPQLVPVPTGDFAMGLGALMQVQRGVLREQRARFLVLWESAGDLVDRWKACEVNA